MHSSRTPTSVFCGCFVMCRRLASKALVCRSHSVSTSNSTLAEWAQVQKESTSIAKYEMTRVPKTWRSGSSQSFSVRSWELPVLVRRMSESPVWFRIRSQSSSFNKKGSGIDAYLQWRQLPIKYQTTTHDSHDETQKKMARSVQLKYERNPNSCGRLGQTR